MKSFKELYKAEQFPVFQNRMFHSEADAKNCIKGDILLVQDLKTGLVFNHDFKPELMKYDADYQNEQAVSSIFQTHLANIAALIKTHFQDYSLIEVGCGKGYFLEHLQKTGFKITGLDPTYEGENPNIIKEYFTPLSGLNADGIILRHVLEHVKNPVEFLINLREANSGQGKIYIEVPCFDWICKQRAWVDIYYEHVNYFRIADFERMFDHIYASGHTFGGQYFYVIADLASIHYPMRKLSDNFDFPDDFLETVTLITQNRTEQNRTEQNRTFYYLGWRIKGGYF